MIEFTYIFLPLEIKVSFFKPQKCIFSQLIYLVKRNFRSHFFCKCLNPLVNKIYEVMWGREILTSRKKQSNYFPKEPSWLQLAMMHLVVRNLAKISQGWFIIGSLLQMLKAKTLTEKDAEHSSCSSLAKTKSENFFVCPNHSFWKKLLLARP